MEPHSIHELLLPPKPPHLWFRQKDKRLWLLPSPYSASPGREEDLVTLESKNG